MHSVQPLPHMAEDAVDVGRATPPQPSPRATTGGLTTFALPPNGPAGGVQHHHRDRRDEPPPPPPQPTSYKSNPWTLQFIDAAVEARYCEFQYITSGFYGGKLYLLAALMIVALSFVVFQPPPMPVPTVFGQPFWIPLDVAFVFNILNLVFAFVPALRPYREIIFLLTIFTHWPGYTVMVMYAKSPRMYRYTYMTGCYYFCTFSAQPRFSRVFPFLTIVPLTTLIVSTLVVPSYFQTHSPMEIIYWPMALTPLILLRFFERRSREAFVVRERAEAALYDMAVKMAETRKIVVNFFPPTPTYELLLGSQASTVFAPAASSSMASPSVRNMRRSERLLSTVLVLTDLAGFTAWAAATPPLKVMQTLDAMFNQIDALAARHNVEKVCTVGDAYFGAIFRTLRAVAAQTATPGEGTELTAFGGAHDDSAESLANRCHEAIVFATEILPTSGSLRMRVGVHCGDVVGGFVGCDPPRFDLFGPAVDFVKELEQKSTNGLVHISHAVEDAARLVGEGNVIGSTEMGVFVDSWCRHAPPASPPASGGMAGGDKRPPPHDSEAGTLASVRLTSAAVFLSSKIDEDTVASLCEQICSLTEDRTMGLQRATSNTLAAVTSLSVLSEAPRSPRRVRGLVESSDDGDDDLLATVPDGGAFRAGAQERHNLPGLHDIVTDENDGLSSDGPATADKKKYAFSPFLLYFYDARVEAKYLQWLQGTAIPTTVAAVFIVQHGVIIAAHLALACFDTVQDRLVLMYIVLATFGLSAYVRFVRDVSLRRQNGSTRRHARLGSSLRSRLLSSIAPIRHALFIIAVFYSMSIVASLGITSVCSDGRSQDQRVQAIGDVVVSYMLFATLIAQLILEVRLPIRLAMNVFICTAELGWIALRRATLKDEVKVYEMYPLVLFLAASVLSYFADYSLRSAFASTTKLRQMQHSALGSLLEIGDRALDIMLPRFAIDAMMLASRQRRGGADTPVDGETLSLLESSSAFTDDHSSTELAARTVLVDRDRDGKCMVWEYNFAVVLFVRVAMPHHHGHSGDATTDRTLIARTHQAVSMLERIGRCHNVSKVKSFGTTVLFVAGIHQAGGRRRGTFALDSSAMLSTDSVASSTFASTCVAETVRAALEMIRDIRSHNAVTPAGSFSGSGNASVTAGIHCGPCFGAVIGDIGLGFDTFGDTVNTASRMQSVAQDGTLIVSSSVQALLPTGEVDAFDDVDVEFSVTPRGAVPIKGKGRLDVFHVVERAAT